MAKVKAVIMALTDKHKNALVYTEDGQYFKTRIKPDPPVGSTVLVEVSLPVVFNKLLAVAAAVLLILFIGLLPRFATTPASAAYLNIALYPEMELWVNSDGKVTQVKIAGSGDNTYTDTLKGKNLYDALGQLIQYSKERGYLNTNSQDIIISSFIKSDDVNIPSINESQLKNFILGELKKSQYQGAVVLTSLGEDVIKSAKDAHVSLGKYVVYEKCREKNLPVSLNTLREKDVTSALSLAGIEAKDLFGQDYIEIGEQHHSKLVENTGDTPRQARPLQRNTVDTNQENQSQNNMMRQNHQINHSNSMPMEQPGNDQHGDVKDNSVKETMQSPGVSMPVHDRGTNPGSHMSMTRDN